MAAAVQGFNTARVRPTSFQPEAKDGSGAFRVRCGYSHMAFDDPIVFPGQPGRSHLHVFFGNTAIDANSTTNSIANGGGSTCSGGILNRSGYWVPAMVDSQTGRAVVPIDMIVYYKSGYTRMANSSLRPFPTGLRIVAGSTASQSGPFLPSYTAMHHYYCELPNGTHVPREQHIPPCPVGGKIWSVLEFPNCWDGVNLDSTDHRSHMTYSSRHENVCPPSHPVPVPVLSFNIQYPVAAGQDSTMWRLSSDIYSSTLPGGYTMHGDVWVAWDEGIKTAWTDNCVRASLDCGAFILGDGRELY
jgi:Domain of unknown function (DUF1996)